MSTLKTANIQDTSGSNNSTPEEINKGRAKAWVNFDGTAATIGSGRNNFNVAAVTHNSTGDYTITFTNNMPNANYVVTGTAGYGSSYWVNMHPHTVSNSPWEQAPTTSAFRVTTSRDGSNASREDPGYVNVVVFGD